MADDPLDTNPPIAAPVRESNRKTKCVFCDCVMTADGADIWHLGDRAKEFKKFDERLAKKDEEIARLNEEIRVLKTERDALKGAASSGSTRHVGHLVSRG